MSLEFDGVDDAIDLGAFDVSNGLDKLTLMSWVCLNGSSDDRLISKANGEAVSDHWWALNMPSLTLAIRLKTAGTTTQLQAGTFSLNTWYHVAMVYDGATMKLYKDGVEIGSASKSGTVSQDAGANVRLADNPVGDRCLDGCMEDARIYESALTVDELSTIIALRGLDHVTTGLVHRYKLGGEDGAVASGAGSVIDTGSSPVHGTPVSAPVYRGTNLRSTRRVA
jgi:hypothetical protein